MIFMQSCKSRICLFSLFLVTVDFLPALTLELSSRSRKLITICLILDGLADLLFDLIEVDCICLRANVKTFLATATHLYFLRILWLQIKLAMNLFLYCSWLRNIALYLANHQILHKLLLFLCVHLYWNRNIFIQQSLTSLFVQFFQSCVIIQFYF